MEHSYTLPNGQTITMMDDLNNNWHVFCDNEDGSNHWYKEFRTEKEAKDEFERWRK